MKDDHKVHKHRHKHEERVHKKCRKREKYQDRSRSRSQDGSSSHSQGNSRSSSYERNRSKSPVQSRLKHKRRSRSSSRDNIRTHKSPEHRRKGRENYVKSEENRSNGRNKRFTVKSEPLSDDEVQGRSSQGLRNEDKPRWGRNDDKEDKKPMENKAKPDFGLSGKLAEEVNTYKGVVIKYSQPPEARMPKRRWRLYPFKGDQQLPTLYIHRQSAYLIGRDRVVADLPIDHPSCSKQHAVLQYRVVPYRKENGMKGNRIRPYIIDLESANGTFVNNKKIDPKKYVELLEKDVIKFAFSSREYVLLHEHSTQDEEADDNVLMVNE